MNVESARSRLNRAKDVYLRECDAVQRELDGCVRIDPVHLEAAVAVQDEMAIDPTRLVLAANEQPPEPKRHKK